MYAWDVLSEFFEVSKYCSNAFKNREHMLPGTKTPPQMAQLILLKPQPIWSVSVHYMVLLNVSTKHLETRCGQSPQLNWRLLDQRIVWIQSGK